MPKSEFVRKLSTSIAATEAVLDMCLTPMEPGNQPASQVYALLAVRLRNLHAIEQAQLRDDIASMAHEPPNLLSTQNGTQRFVY